MGPALCRLCGVVAWAFWTSWCLALEVEVSQNTGRLMPYQVFELTFRHDNDYPDPTWDVDLRVTFTSPSGREVELGGFFFGSSKPQKPIIRQWTDGRGRRRTSATWPCKPADLWRARHAPSELGTWRFRYVFRSPNGETATGSGSFEVVRGRVHQEGWVRINARSPFRFVFEDGSPFFPVGFQDGFFDSNHNGSALDAFSLEGPFRPDPEGRRPKPPPGAMFVRGPSMNPVNGDVYFRRHAQAGFNLWRFSPHNFSMPVFGVNYDPKSPTPARIDWKQAAMVDELLRMTHKYGIRNYYGIFGFARVFNDKPNDPAAMAKVKRLVKYSVDRWGALVDFWEILNEQKAAKEWYDIIVPYLKSIDPYHKPVATSWQRPELPYIDINAPHWYGREDELSSSRTTAARARAAKRLGKPVVFGEQGNGGGRPELIPRGIGGVWDPGSARRMRVRLWTALFNEIALVFWETSYAKDGHHMNLWIGPRERQYVHAFQEFARLLDADVRMTPVELSGPQTSRVEAYGLRSPRCAAVYLHHRGCATCERLRREGKKPQHDWNHERGKVTGLKIALDVPVAAGYWYDPRDGSIVARVNPSAARRELRVPPFSVDMAFLVSPAGPPDADHDGLANDRDTDDDNDGVPDARDAFPLEPAEWADADGDLIGDNLDADINADGLPDDRDKNGTPDNQETDWDGDGVPNASAVPWDAFPRDRKEWRDTDGDGVGDNADPDDDGDGWSDAEERKAGTNPLDAVSFPEKGARGPAGEATVTLNSAVKHQTIRGWSCNPHYLKGPREQREQVLYDAVNELGLNRMRWQQPNGNRSAMRRWEWENDNGDPDLTDYSRLNTADADRFVEAYVLPFKRLVEARGEPFELWLSPSFFRGGSTGDVPAFLLHSPGEYAEYATSFILYLKRKYGVTTDHYAICNEAGNSNVFSPRVVIEMTKALGERMAALGLPTRGQFSDGVNARVTWRYIQAGRDDPELWKHVDVLSYHWYGGKNQQAMAQIRDFARHHGMSTAQSEFMHLTIDHLYDDLTIGGVSYWSIYGLGGPGRGQNYHFGLDGTSFRRGRHFWNFRQVLHYARPGAVRIEATSDDPAIRPLAFVREGKTTVVLINTARPYREREATVANLPPGRYGFCHTVALRPYKELGIRQVGNDGRLTVRLAPNSVATLYPCPRANLPPTVVIWRAEPSFLKTPASRVKLSASGEDPELAGLSYSWSVAQAPKGATVRLAEPESPATAATGLTAPGGYAFEVKVSDGANTLARRVLLNVFEGNQPPLVFDVHNRIPVLITLPQNNTLLIAGGLDPEGDKLTFRWSVLRQPPGSDVRLEAPKEQRCKVTNIAKSGDHVFKVEVSDGHHTIAKTLTVPVYPVNAAPVIEAVEARPATLTLPVAATTLSARTRDPDGDVITHWWRVIRKPSGARPAFTKQGDRETRVTGLTVPGNYLFELTAVDRTKASRRALTVVIRPKDAPALPASAGGEPPDARSKGDKVIARGTTAGVVMRKGQAWLEVRSSTGKTTRYIPRWFGGVPRDGGGPEKAVVQAIAKLKVGERVTIRWHVDNHVRIEAVQPAP